MARRGSEANRTAQLSYSLIQEKTHDEKRRTRKAQKIVRVLQDFLGRESLTGLRAVDIGCSTGFTTDALQTAGATVIGVDIDVPGLVHAKATFGTRVYFLCANGEGLPFPDRSIDILVFNHIYEHVVDPDAVMKEIIRVLSPDGVVYLGLGNKFQVLEPHYRLPLLSWVPRKLADRYVAASGRAPDYYEQYRTRRGLLQMCDGLTLWDYTYTVLRNSERFAAQDMVPARLANAPAVLWRALAPIMPTFLWLGTVGDRSPATAVVAERPGKIRTRRHPVPAAADHGRRAADRAAATQPAGASGHPNADG